MPEGEHVLVHARVWEAVKVMPGGNESVSEKSVLSVNARSLKEASHELSQQKSVRAVPSDAPSA